jgi:hypothetical protein
MSGDIDDFSNALYMAYVAGQLDLLRSYVDAGRPVPQYDVFVRGSARMPVHVLVAQLLGRCSPQQSKDSRRAGRPRRVASEAPPAEQAERNAAWLVAFAQKRWREKNRGHQRVRSSATDEMVTAAIAEAAKTFKVPVATIKKRNIRAFLKNGTIVVS